MSNPILEVKNITKAFGNDDESNIVLDNLSMQLNEGESMGLVGASGSGKSTLLHILGGLEKPNSGTVSIKGEIISNLNPDESSLFRSKEIGFVYQFHHLLPDLTAIENIALPALLSGKTEEEALDISYLLLKQVNLSKKEENIPSELSGGERQRIAIARAMANKPSCLFMDEPTGNLDTKNVENFMDLLMEMVRTQEITLIVATHDNNVSSRLDRLLSLE